MIVDQRIDWYVVIRKTCPCNVYPPKPHFYIEKTGVCRGVPIFLIFALKHRLWVPTIYVLSKNKKNIKIFLMKFSIFTGEKNLNIYCMGKFS